MQNAILTPELARHLAWISSDMNRQVGVLINRRGYIEYTFVGDAHRIYIPDVGRQRVGQGRLRGLRHIHTVFGESGLQAEDLADLKKLRLDLVAALEITPTGEPGKLWFAHAQPLRTGTAKIQEHVARSIHDLDLDFTELMEAIEHELGRTFQSQEAGDGRNRAVLVGVYPHRQAGERSLAELIELAATAQVTVLDTIVQQRPHVDTKFVVGRGKLEEVVLRCLDLSADLVIFDHNLTPAQSRAIAAASELKILDRTQLILDIFAQHATSKDGKLQVELAQLKYMLPRLTDLDTGLSRLTGGIGGRGPGETKLEINRRRARDRIARLNRDIEKLSERRQRKRSLRSQTKIPVISIVGYTNAGKSTLLNFLTHSQVEVADKLFATLDPRSRRLRFPKEREAIITDTVGFIRNLPPDLINAFRATLEELETADILLHVIDVADPDRNDKIQAVNQTLQDLGLSGLPQMLVFNKSDLVQDFEAQAIARKAEGVAVSAKSGWGIEALVEHISKKLWQTEALDMPWNEQANLVR